MSRRYSISQARANLPAIVDSAIGGQAIELTRRGKPVAAVVSIGELERLRAQRETFVASYQRFLDRYDLSEIGVDEGYFDGTRDSGSGRDVAL